MRLLRLPAGWRTRKVALVAIGACIALITGCRMLTNHMVTREERNSPRNLQTGILLGAEERDLGPENAKGAVLFVHGFVGAGNNFNDLPDRVARMGWRVRVMRLPGHGTGPRDYEKTTSEELIEAVREELAAMKSKHPRVTLVGHSMGSTLSVLAAAQDGADKIVLGAPYFGVSYKWYYGLKPEQWTTLFHPFVRWVYKGHIFMKVNRKEVKKDILSYDWIPTRGVVTLQKLGEEAKRTEILQKVTCPALMLLASTDSAASPGEAEKAFNALGSTEKKLVWLKNSDHHIFWDYDHVRVAEEVESFLGPPPA